MKPPSGSPPSRPSDDESIAATAAAWLAQRDDAFTAAEAAAFECWRAADPRHDAAVVRFFPRGLGPTASATADRH